MAVYVGDQNNVAFRYESGTYAVASGGRQWLGAIQNLEIDENVNILPIRYQGGLTRNVNQWVNGPLDMNVSYTLLPQDWRPMLFVLGSCVDAGSPSPYTHVISETNSASGNAMTSGPRNPFVSMTMEVSQKGAATGENFIRTIGGVTVNSATINMTPGEFVSMDIEAIGQSGTFSSGAITAPTENTTRPFVWEDVRVHIPSGTVYDNTISATVTINNNLVQQHYLNGSRSIESPIPTNRDYEITLNTHGRSDLIKTLYDSYFMPGSEFNLMIEVNAKDAGTGSRNAFFIFSGCKMTDFSAPNPSEGIDEHNLTIKPKNCVVNVNDTTELYNGWAI